MLLYVGCIACGPPSGHIVLTGSNTILRPALLTLPCTSLILAAITLKNFAVINFKQSRDVEATLFLRINRDEQSTLYS